MCSNCNTVLNTQILPFVRNLNAKRAFVVYLPVNFSETIMPQDETAIREKFNINGEYLFYPTQIRPYKNVQMIFKALNILKDDYKDLKLVLTGNTEDLPETHSLIYRYGINNRIIRTGSVEEGELYGLYKYASAVPVISLFEGGFPWQACEALYTQTPVIVSDIDIVMERITACGFTKENCGLIIVNPNDENDVAGAIRQALLSRDYTAENQKPFAEKLFSYNWAYATEGYHEIFSKTSK